MSVFSACFIQPIIYLRGRLKSGGRDVQMHSGVIQTEKVKNTGSDPRQR